MIANQMIKMNIKTPFGKNMVKKMIFFIFGCLRLCLELGNYFLKCE